MNQIRFGSFAVLEILGEECVEQRVSHTDCHPTEPEKCCCDGELPFVEERSDSLCRKGGEVPLDD